MLIETQNLPEHRQPRAVVGHVHQLRERHPPEGQLQGVEVAELPGQQPKSVTNVLGYFELKVLNVGELAQVLASLVGEVEPEGVQLGAYLKRNSFISSRPVLKVVVLKDTG